MLAFTAVWQKTSRCVLSKQAAGGVWHAALLSKLVEQAGRGSRQAAHQGEQEQLVQLHEQARGGLVNGRHLQQGAGSL